ncbi:hypothetical protein ACLB2K_048223 [Fragaria x ananassa]
MKMNAYSSSSSSSSPPEAQVPPEPKKSPGGWRAIKYILGNESFEKLASMSLIANMSVYLTTKYNLGGLFMVNVVNIWNGSSNVAALAGAFVSDTYLGRFRTLLCGSISSLLINLSTCHFFHLNFELHFVGYGDDSPNCRHTPIETLPRVRCSIPGLPSAQDLAVGRTLYGPGFTINRGGWDSALQHCIRC